MSHQLPYEDAKFDLVFVNFVFYTLPREYLLRTVSEIDRVLKDGGTLVIGDFFPDKPHARSEKHSLGEFTYKQYYFEAFTSSNLYHLRERMTYKFGDPCTEIQYIAGGDDNMCAIYVLAKSLFERYPFRNI